MKEIKDFIITFLKAETEASDASVTRRCVKSPDFELMQLKKCKVTPK